MPKTPSKTHIPPAYADALPDTMPTMSVVSLEEILPDPDNANKGTQRGAAILERSLRANGVGRSILIDKNRKTIAGNKTAEACASVGIEDVVIVQVTGNQIVAVQRMDLDLDDEGGQARELAFLDNRAAEVNLAWDLEALVSQSEGGLDLSQGFNELELQQIHATLTNSTAFLDTFIQTPMQTPLPADSGAALATPADHSRQEISSGSATDAPAASASTIPAPSQGTEVAEASSVKSTETTTTETTTQGTDLEAVTLAETPPLKPVETVTLQFVLIPATRDAIAARLRQVQKEHDYATLAHALCHLLEIPYAQ